MSLEAARSQAFEELRAIPIEPRLIDAILRQVSEQTTKPGLVRVLQEFVSLLSQKAPTTVRPDSFLSRLEEIVLSNQTSIEALTDLLVEKRVVTQEEIREKIAAQRKTLSKEGHPHDAYRL